MFNKYIIEKIGYYVYCLRDPLSREIFYIGKGSGNRVFDHGLDALDNEIESEKLNRIREIENAGQKVEYLILRHGLKESEAFEVEATLIDFIGINSISNIQYGRHSADFGLKSVEEISALYSAPPLRTDLPLLLININKRFRRDMTEAEVFEATRKAWVTGPRRERARYAVATYQGLTREVYQITSWFKVDQRWGFDGQVAESEIREALRYKSVTHLVKRGAANPIQYLNC